MDSHGSQLPLPAPASLQRVLAPRSIAVVGASQDPTKRGHQVVRSLLAGPFQGPIFPVNPGGGELLGLPVAASLDELAGRVDLAVVCTPAGTAPTVVEACGRAGVAGAVVLALGFGEMGGEGARLEQELRNAARRWGVRVIGPNTSGMLNLGVGLDLIGVPGIRPGPLALVAQSGNITLSLLQESASGGGPGFSVCVGVGNEIDVGYHEYLHFLADDPGTRAILVYAEGIRDGRSFLEAARSVSPRKPIALLKGGRTRAGEASARSHTGSVSTSHDVFRNALRQAGVVEVDRSDELLATGRTLALQPPIGRGQGVAILSDGGGQATLAADALSAAGVELTPLSGDTRERLRSLLPAAASVVNPVDMAGACDRNPALFAPLLEILLEDPSVGGVLVVGLFGGYAVRFARELAEGESRAAGEMAHLARASGKAVVIHSIYGEAGTPPLLSLMEKGIPVIRSLDAACRAVAALRERGALLDRARSERAAAPVPPVRQSGERGGGANDDPVATALGQGRSTLLETEARALLEARGVPLVPGVFCETATAAGDAARRSRGPVCLKVVSTTVSHKSEAGGVILGIRGAEAATTAFRGMVRSVNRYARGSGIPPGIVGALVTPLLPPPGVELLVGARRDPVFGPVLTVGAGGTAVELHRDVALRVLPLGPGEALAMLDELRIAPLFRGFRGGSPLDLEALERVMEGVARCILEVPELEEIEVNPVFLYRDRALVVDARAFLSVPRRDEASAVPVPAGAVGA